MYSPTPLHKQNVTQGNFLKWNSIHLNSIFSFFKTSWHTKVKEPNLAFNLLLTGREIVWLISFPRILALCEMKTPHPWFKLNLSIFSNGNYYAISDSSSLCGNSHAILSWCMYLPSFYVLGSMWYKVIF